MIDNAEISQADLSVPPPQLAMLQLITGKWVSQAIYVAAELGVADLLAEGERSVDELARTLDANDDALYRLLRALSSLGVFIESEGRRFRNSPLGETLRRDAPGSIRGFARHVGMDVAWAAWGDLINSVRTGKSGFDRVTGETVFEYISTRPAAAEVINESMTSICESESRAVVEAYDFSRARVIVDVGGGQGLLLARILNANPNARGILFELPHASAGARHLFARHGLTHRVDVVAGDALESVRSGGDVYIMKHVVHDWDDDRAIRFISNCEQALAPGGKLLLIETVLTPPETPHFGKLLDLEMLVMSSGGRERTLDEYRRLLARAGLELRANYPTRGPHSIVEGIRP
jgi:C-methyltransferase